MSLSTARATAAAPSLRAPAAAVRPFLGLIDSVLVEDGGEFEFPGAIARSHATAAWTWMRRDLGSGLIDADGPDSPDAQQLLDAAMPQLLQRAHAALAAAADTREAERRLRTQLGGEGEWQRLRMVLEALKCRALLAKAKSFGRAVNGLTDESALAQALQAMPLQDQAVAALLMQATLGQVSNPARLVTATVRIAGAPTEAAVQRVGLAPLLDAVLAHAQNQVPALQVHGTFADIDLTCRAIHRFHRLVRALHTHVELDRNGRRAAIVGAVTKRVSDRVEARLRDVPMDINQALRRAREGTDRLDGDRLLSALNGVYILATVRECRESLALNALFDRSWTQVGEALEMHIQRNLDLLRQNPEDTVTSERLASSIKMAELRFNSEYADVLRRAKEAVERR
ncbi:MAG TPA: hypothetical protein VGN80_07720 [Devosiaceae bacterium]|jgi:hypothetical protein|nr:hypothetical protein [Devosiaceae bacterium]